MARLVLAYNECYPVGIMKLLFIICTAIAFAAVGCTKSSEPKSEEISEALIDREKKGTTAIFALGDSLTAGTQDAATLDEIQGTSWISQLATQVAVNTNVLYSFPSMRIDGTRIDPTEKPTNFAIPGLELEEAIEEVKPISLLEGLPVNLPAYLMPYWTEEEPQTTLDSLMQALHNDSSTEQWVFLWLGANDALFDFTNYDHITGDVLNAETPSPEEFFSLYKSILSRISDSNATHIFTFTIPDLTKTGFFFTSLDLALFLADDSPMQIINAGDLVPLHVAVEIYFSVQFGADPAVILNSLMPNEVLDLDEQALVIDRIAQYNDAIRVISHDNGAHLIDVASEFNDILDSNYELKTGRVLSRSWLGGGIFSLDGMHPSPTGQALITNAVIDELNDLLEREIPLIVIEDIYASDPYRDMDGDGKVAGPTWEPQPNTPASLLRIFVDGNDSLEN